MAGKIEAKAERPAPAKRSRLLAVSPESVEPRRPKILVYGAGGVGKTFAAIDFPAVYYFDIEEGATYEEYRAKLRAADAGYLGPDKGAGDFDIVIEQVEALATEQHKYRTMVFDSASKLFYNAISEESDRLGDKDEFGRSKRVPVRQMQKLIRLVNKADMNAIYICHEKELWGLNDKKQREVVGHTFDAWDKLSYELDLIIRVVKIGSGKTAIRKAYIGKSRLASFPEGESFPWSYAEFAERYGKAIIEKEVKPLVLATVEQLTEIHSLLERVKPPTEDWESKVFKRAEVDSWEEMETDKIAACIVKLREHGGLPAPDKLVPEKTETPTPQENATHVRRVNGEDA